MIYAFGEFELDTQLFELHRDGRPCALEPQVFNVLRYLIEHADHVVTKDELLENLWPGRVVSESALTSRLKTARRILGDSGREQRFIKTLHGRGYRFVAAVEQRADGTSPRSRSALEAPRTPASVSVPRPSAPVGRETELGVLEQLWRVAAGGRLQLVFIDGEGGLGKTTLISAFLDGLRAAEKAQIAVGQCVELSAADAAWPDGTITSQFRFTHTLYREALYAGLPAGRRKRLHAQIGERLERGFGAAAAERATELAIHFTVGGDYDRATHYRFAAAQLAFARGGYREAIGHLEQGLALLASHADIPEHEPRELGFQLLLAPALIQTGGWSEPRAEAALSRALEIAERLDDPRLPSVLYNLAGVYELRGEYAESQRWLEHQHALPKPFETPLAKLESHELLACSLYHQGDFENALEHAEAGLAAANVFDSDTKLYIYGENPRVSCHNWAGLAQWFLGYPDRARGPSTKAH